jgi:iron complex transport system substrate-binding protein
MLGQLGSQPLRSPGGIVDRSVDGVDEVPAIANDRFLILPQEAVNPGIRFIDGIEARAAELYPDAFADLAGTEGFGLSATYDAS